MHQKVKSKFSIGNQSLLLIMLANISFVLAVAVVTAAVPAESHGGYSRPKPQCPRIRCVDKINQCGITYRACYDMCKPEQSPVVPPCPSTTTTTAAPSTTRYPTSDDCSTRTVCADYVNACGQMYGGCFPDCKPWPTFTPPPCTSTTTPPGTTVYDPPPPTTTPSTSDSCSTQTVCADYVNECGQWYGGCFSACTPWPTFNRPSCTSTPSTLSISALPTFTSSYAPPVTTTAPYPPSVTPSSRDCSSRTVCADYLKTCTVGTTTENLTYGG